MVKLNLMKATSVAFARDKCGCGAGGKTAIFGLLKRDGKVYTVVVKDTKTDTLMPIITSKSNLIVFLHR